MKKPDLIKAFEDIQGVSETGDFRGHIDQDLAIELGEISQEFFEGKRLQGMSYEYN